MEKQGLAENNTEVKFELKKFRDFLEISKKNRLADLENSRSQQMHATLDRRPKRPCYHKERDLKQTRLSNQNSKQLQAKKSQELYRKQQLLEEITQTQVQSTESLDQKSCKVSERQKKISQL